MNLSKNATQPSLKTALDRAFSQFDRVLKSYQPQLQTREVGRVASVSEGIATVVGLASVKADELVRFPGNLLGIAFNLDPNELGIILLGSSEQLEVGDEVHSTGRVMDVPVGEALLGRTLDATGRPLDDRGLLKAKERRPLEREAPAIMDRDPVTVPLQTGIEAIDALIPVGRGQRELIVGDRGTGKTAIAVDTILNQKNSGVLCIYCAIAQRTAAVAKVIAQLEDRGVLDSCIVVVASGEDPPGLQYITPYAATSMGEYFMERGRDVLIVYDDLTRHAWAYRELSLLLRRPPGREAYPGDIFYIHSRMLERSTHLNSDLGGGSLTALPIVETQAQNISAYIPTNLISITDGQIYLSPDLFQKSIFPAISVGKSVSRVGGKAQLPSYNAVAGDLRLSYSQFQEVEAFARFGTQLDEETRHILERGRRVREVLKQPQSSPLSVPEQIAILMAVNKGILDLVPLERVREAKQAIQNATLERVPEICDRIESGEILGDEDWEAMRNVATEAVQHLRMGTYGEKQTKDEGRRTNDP